MAAALAAALMEGGTVARAVETANPSLFYNSASSNSASSGFDSTNDTSLSRVALLARFAEAAAAPVQFEQTSLFGGRDFESAAPLGRNLVLEFGSRMGDAPDFGSDGLFANLDGAMSPLSQTGREVHAGSSFGMGDGLSLNFGESVGESNSLLPAFGPQWMQTPLAGATRNEGFAQSGFAGLNWNATPWASLGLVARQASAQAPTASANLAKVSTQAVGAAGKVAFGDGWVTTFSYNERITQLDLRPAANLLAAGETQHSRSYGVGIAKHGLFGDDTVGLEVSRPALSPLGGVDLDASPTADPFDGFISSATRPIMSGDSQETDVQLGYVTTFLDGALALQANAGYQMNSAGQAGNNGVAVLSRAKINF